MTMDMLEDKSGERDYALERLIMLSDGVFAIAITLLALELRPPEGWDHSLRSLGLLMWRQGLAFLLSFVVIAGFWIAHRKMFGRFRSADMGLTVLNLFMLCVITLVPVVNNMAFEGGPGGGGFTLYWAIFCLLGIANAGIWIYSAFVKPSLFRSPPPKQARRLILVTMLIMPVSMPLLGLVVAGAQVWVLAPVIALVLAARIFRSRLKQSIEPEWRS
ncbi:putative membrane protein [Brevundimonas alba]|uniref:Putative membrane protein n=1 Tax=Brevundimonas alba TaxID=74314 RepID=A0A7X5YLK0_9CAUL|nr:TMEM175 family protein [Brevundimonas alba]NJC42183.1 putative membrane protein [Brevundimonas alba]